VGLDQFFACFKNREIPCHHTTQQLQSGAYINCMGAKLGRAAQRHRFSFFQKSNKEFFLCSVLNQFRERRSELDSLKKRRVREGVWSNAGRQAGRAKPDAASKKSCSVLS
jgi:hypothetical protein